MITDKIYEYCNNAGLTISKFEKLCGIGNGSVGKWRLHGSNPSMNSLSKIEKTTGIPMYMWLGEGKI